MDFGYLENIDNVDFALPPDRPGTAKTLAAVKKKKATEVYAGCAKWGRKEWVGMIYPPKTKEADFLQHYVQHFNCIELNAMFYRVFPGTVTVKWASHAKSDFRFCPKFTQAITHFKRLKNAEAETNAFLESLSGFGDKLGHSFLQLDDRFGPKNPDTLADYLGSLPKDFKLCVELRHKEWFEDTAIMDEAFDQLRKLKVGTVITDASGRRDVLHMNLTTPVAFIRFVSNNMHPTDYTRMNEWVDRFKVWMDGGIEKIYFFMHCHDERNSPILCKYFIERMNKVAGTKIPPPKIIGETASLF